MNLIDRPTMRATVQHEISICESFIDFLFNCNQTEKFIELFAPVCKVVGSVTCWSCYHSCAINHKSATTSPVYKREVHVAGCCSCWR